MALTTVTLKLHKFSVLGGSWHPPAAAAAVVEDVALFLALFVFWLSARWAAKTLGWHERLNDVSTPVLVLLLRASVVAFTSITLVFLGIEHLYFCSTK